MSNSSDTEKESLLDKYLRRVLKMWKYVSTGIWKDQRKTFWVNLIKTLNLSVRSFLNSELQLRAGALTYQTILAIVPALALVFAIGRGFGFQNLLETQLFHGLPAQREALSTTFKFVDSYLEQSSEGIFVGIGILFLLWTLISLISNVEDAFNKIWDLKHGRTFWRKITDYTAIFLILPIIMICAGGIMVLMSTTLQNLLPFAFLSPVVKWLLDLLSLALVWLFFAGSYMLIPNTTVKFKNAMISGIMAGTAFSILQWLFVSGQVYVTRYNAIYGSFAFLPLLLIWLQLVWTITLSGAVLCFSSQNIFEFSFANEIQNISKDYRWHITLAVMQICIQRMEKEEPPLSPHEIALKYELPIQLVQDSASRLEQAGLLLSVLKGKDKDAEPAISPAIDPSEISIATIIKRLGELGENDFLPGFQTRFAPLSRALKQIREQLLIEAAKTKFSQLKINN